MHEKDYTSYKIRFYGLQHNELEKMQVIFTFSFITRIILFIYFYSIILAKH